MAGGGRRVVVVVVSWCFEPVVSLVRNPRNWGVSLRARTTDSDSLLVPLRRSLSLKGVDAMRRIRDRVAGLDVRSEEHTSELQSLMRISYAVFCLKKKTESKNKIIDITQNGARKMQMNTNN